LEVLAVRPPGSAQALEGRDNPGPGDRAIGNHHQNAETASRTGLCIGGAWQYSRATKGADEKRAPPHSIT
jgi:hypothetical protein